MDWWWTVLALTAHLGPGEDDRWARVLTGLDLQRAVALHTADATALRGVYASEAAAADDADLIDAYRARGGRLEGAVLRVEQVDVRRAVDDEVVLDVVDRLGPARVRWDDGSATALPADEPTRRRVVLRWTDDGWRISEARRRAPE